MKHEKKAKDKKSVGGDGRKSSLESEQGLCTLRKLNKELFSRLCILEVRTFAPGRTCLISKKNSKAVIWLLSLIVHLDTDYCYFLGRWIPRKKKKKGKKRKKRIEGRYKLHKFVITKTFICIVFLRKVFIHIFMNEILSNLKMLIVKLGNFILRFVFYVSFDYEPRKFRASTICCLKKAHIYLDP